MRKSSGYRKDLGHWGGEKYASEYLEKKGYQLVAKIIIVLMARST